MSSEQVVMSDIADSPKGEREILLAVNDLSKTYRVYSSPHHRLLQAVSDRRGWNKSYCFEVKADEAVSFDLARGESIAIVGRNGCGKSTLLQMIAGTLAPTRGTVELTGRVSALLELGAGFNPDFSGRQNWRINASIQGLSDKQIKEIEPKVEDFAEIGAFMDEPVRTYSSGMYVRLAFAAAVHVVPDLLIVDEALAVGDIFFQQKCFDYLANELSGASKLIVTHDLSSAVRLADRCIVMDKGVVVFDGEPLEAVEIYTSMHLSERTGRVRKSVDGEVLDTVDAPTGLHPSATARSSSDEALSVRGIGVDEWTGASWRALEPEAVVLSPGTRIRLRCDLDVGTDVAEPVWGYLVRDRVGNPLFGQNTVGSGLPAEPLRVGRHMLDLVFEWPEVDGGEYSITVGLGDGQHPLHHTIIAWIQSVLRVTSNPERAVHGSFNNDLIEVSVAKIRPND